MLKKLATVVAAAAAMLGLVGAADVPDDPYAWLEEIEGSRALEWARAESARTLGILEKDPRFATLREEAHTILTSPSRLPLGEIHRGASTTSGRTKPTSVASGVVRALRAIGRASLGGKR